MLFRSESEINRFQQGSVGHIVWIKELCLNISLDAFSLSPTPLFTLSSTPKQELHRPNMDGHLGKIEKRMDMLVQSDRLSREGKTPGPYLEQKL